MSGREPGHRSLRPWFGLDRRPAGPSASGPGPPSLTSSRPLHSHPSGPPPASIRTASAPPRPLSFERLGFDGGHRWLFITNVFNSCYGQICSLFFIYWFQVTVALPLLLMCWWSARDSIMVPLWCAAPPCVSCRTRWVGWAARSVGRAVALRSSAITSPTHREWLWPPLTSSRSSPPSS